MTITLEFLVAIVSFGGLLVAGMPIPLAILVPAILFLLSDGGMPALKGLGLVSWGSINSFTLTAIPLFILMAEVLQQSRVSLRVYKGLAQLVSRIPGGLLQTNIAGCALFAAICGSSVATAATIGRVALPELVRRKYSRSLAAGSIAAGGTLGILIPPSIAMIIYGAFTDTSVAKLFMAGVLPGLLLTVMFMVFIAVYTKVRPGIAPPEACIASKTDFSRALGDVLPLVLLFAVTLGSIYGGLVTPTEAAAIGCAGAIVLSVFYERSTFTIWFSALKKTVRICGNILFIVYAAFVFSYAITYAGIDQQIASFLQSLNLSKLEFFVALFVLYTVLGCLVESLGMIVLTVPLLYPILSQYAIDPVWFGVILVLFIELGQISPPIGINLFVVQSIWDGTLKEVVIGTIPFHLIMFVLLALLVIWPEIALWLPGQMF
jgi:C4-dicarboxylate transporter, DctM subunit